MIRIEVLDNAIADRIRDVRAIGINPTLLDAYSTSLKVGNEKNNFEEVIWDDEIKDIAAELKSYGVCEFTISSNYYSLCNFDMSKTEIIDEVDGNENK